MLNFLGIPSHVASTLIFVPFNSFRSDCFLGFWAPALPDMQMKRRQPRPRPSSLHSLMNSQIASRINRKTENSIGNISELIGSAVTFSPGGRRRRWAEDLEDPAALFQSKIIRNNLMAIQFVQENIISIRLQRHIHWINAIFPCGRYAEVVGIIVSLLSDSS